MLITIKPTVLWLGLLTILLCSCAKNNISSPSAEEATLSVPAAVTVNHSSIQTSDLWGKNGELWQPGGRLPDFSFAGYHQSQVSLPIYSVTANVKDFGAKGDGVTDDSHAFKAAIAAAVSGAIFIPEGKYIITDILYLRKSNLVLRGAGPDKTILFFPKPMYQIKALGSQTAVGRPTTAYSFDFAFLAIEGKSESRVLAQITGEARRGDREVQVSSAKKFQVGQQILIRVKEDNDQTLKTFLYAGDPGDIVNGKPLFTQMIVEIVAIAGKKIKINRPLRFDTRKSWQPEIIAFNPSVSESGIEDLRIEFPEVPYPGHFNEQGFNAIELRAVSHCWVKNIHIRNADMGVLLADGASFNTVDQVVISAYEGRNHLAHQGRGSAYERSGRFDGHHAFQVKTSQDNLIVNFDVQAKFVHDLSVEDASGSVFADGKGRDLSFDHHRDTPYENLYTNIDAGLGKSVWTSGGGPGLGRNCGAWGTFWNIRADEQFPLPKSGFSPVMVNFVAIQTSAEIQKELSGAWIEPLLNHTFFPENIWRAQLERRLRESFEAK